MIGPVNDNFMNLILQSNFAVRPDGSVSMRVHAKRHGRVSIHLRVSVARGADGPTQLLPDGAVLEDEIQIQV